MLAVAGAVNNPSVKMVMSVDGQYLPDSAIDNEKNLSVNGDFCPFISEVDEDTLADEFFEESIKLSHKKHVGFIHTSYVGHVSTGEYRENGSSGGMVSWIATALYNDGEIDALIHVKSSSKKGVLFEYDVSSDIDEIQKGAKSRYYPIKLDEVIKIVLADDVKKYAIVGLPCMIKSIRLMMRKDERLRSSIKYCIGIVCGHLKTTGFAESLAWQQGTTPSDIGDVDFRRKLKFRGASSYGFSSTTTSGDTRLSPMESLFGGDWGQGQFKLSACDFCDDVFAETADVVIGDAWLPRYKKDSRGNNAIVSRNQKITDIIEAGRKRGLLTLDEVDSDTVYKTQSSGIRHRTEGLSYRLGRKLSSGAPVPRKRIEAHEITVDDDRALIYQMRESIRDISVTAFHLAKERRNLKVFIDLMKPWISEYNSLLITSRTTRTIKWLRHIITKSIRVVMGMYKREIYPKK